MKFNSERIRLVICLSILFIIMLISPVRASNFIQIEPKLDVELPTVKNQPETEKSPVLIFRSDRNGSLDIYMIPLNQSNSTPNIMTHLTDNIIQLTDNNYDNKWPVLSPDGSKLAFVSNQSGKDYIYIMNIDGSNQHRLTDQIEKNENFPSWSRTGSKIVFSSGGRLAFANSDGTDYQQTNIFSSYACFSQDGNKILYLGIQDSNIYTVNINDTTQITQVTDDQSWKTSPCFSPDGNKIAFAANYGEGVQIYTMNLDGSELNQITNDQNAAGKGGVKWKSPGKIIYFSYEYPDGNSNCDIYSIWTDGTNKQRLTTDSSVDRAPDFGYVDFN